MFNWFKKKDAPKPQITPEEAARRKSASDAAKKREALNAQMQENCNNILILVAEMKEEIAQLKLELNKKDN